MKKLFRFLFSLTCACALLLGAMLPSMRAVAEAPTALSDPIDRMTFFGESTTAHLALRGGIAPERVWANASGTMRLDSDILSRRLIDRTDGTDRIVCELAQRHRPEILVLSFGLNGVMSFSASTERYLRCYGRLTDAILAVSPETRIIVQSVYPVADLPHQTDWQFSVSPAEICRRIEGLNAALREFCRADTRLFYADTASVLVGTDGFLVPDFTTDGIHLTATAYTRILSVLRECARALV